MWLKASASPRILSASQPRSQLAHSGHVRPARLPAKASWKHWGANSKSLCSAVHSASLCSSPLWQCSISSLGESKSRGRREENVKLKPNKRLYLMQISVRIYNIFRHAFEHFSDGLRCNYLLLCRVYSSIVINGFKSSSPARLSELAAVIHVSYFRLQCCKITDCPQYSTIYQGPS